MRTNIMESENFASQMLSMNDESLKNNSMKCSLLENGAIRSILIATNIDHIKPSERVPADLGITPSPHPTFMT